MHPPPRQFSPIGPCDGDARAVFERWHARAPAPTDTLQVLVDVLHAAGHVDDALCRRVASLCRTDIAHVRSLAAFYHFLRPSQPTRWRLLVSDNITDRLAGAEALYARLKQAFDGVAGVSVGLTACIGMSDVAPAALVNGFPVTRLDPARVESLCALIRADVPLIDWPQEWFEVPRIARQTGPLLDAPPPRGRALEAALAGTPEALFQALQDARLTGRGGAGFPTARKWATARAAPGDTRVVVCNADEGEPGTFKDRLLLAAHADKLLEGMTLCAWYTGATQGFIYLRGEYLFLHDTLADAIEQRRVAGLLGRGILGREGLDFDVQIHVGAGAYICGEESALIESLEGHRGIPRRRPPFPVTAGYLQRPSVVNNVETFIAAQWIALQGAAAFRALSRADNGGTKLHSVAGDVRAPGVYEWPVGMSVREMLDACGGAQDGFVQLGGPSGRLLWPQDYDRPVDLATLSSGGSLMVFSARRSAFAAVRNFAHFFAHESCGFCTPCRAGAPLIARQLDSLADGHPHPDTVPDLIDLVNVIHTTSHCGLGHSLGNALLDLHRRHPALMDQGVFFRSEPA